MTTLLLVLIVAGLLVALAVAKAKAKSERGNSQREQPRPRTPLTRNEQAMYLRLRETFPEHVVLAQIAFSSLLTSKSRTTRSTFDRKVADFVLCSKGFGVLAVIELDDATHRGREAEDAARDALLTAADYQVLRFPRVPDGDTLRAAVMSAPRSGMTPSVPK